MTTAAEMRNAILASLEDIELGHLHAYERYAQKNDILRQLYQDEDEDRLNGWNLRRSAYRKTILGQTIHQVRTTWVLTGYMSLRDEDKTELLIDVQADLISIALANDITFGLGNWLDDYQQTMEAESVMFCNVLCHQVKITFDTSHDQEAGIEFDALGNFNTLSAQYDLPPHVVAAQHAKWLQEPPDYSASRPELNQQIQIREDE